MLKRFLIDDWHDVLTTAWSMRVALFWICVWSVLSIWWPFSNILPLYVWAPIGFIMAVSFGIARLLKQPGTEE